MLTVFIATIINKRLKGIRFSCINEITGTFSPFTKD